MNGTKLTLTAVVTVDFLERVPAFALRQLATSDERMPVGLQFQIANQKWPKEQLQVGCDRAEDVIAFVRELAKDELTRRNEPLTDASERRQISAAEQGDEGS